MKYGDILSYDKNTGVLTWKVDRGPKKAGSVAGYIDRHDYIKIMVLGKNLYAHRIAWELFNGKIPEDKEIDHINGNTLDNRISNLRLASRTQNNANRKHHTSTPYKGVSYFTRDNKWRARIKHNKHEIHLGYYNTPDEARTAYLSAANKIFGDFARAA